ncbi:MAG TPA: hypothetical protein VJS37_16465, partial [Terriglobales bacterium]|nr:hypothetical protein [Terriglobales bacterium]
MPKATYTLAQMYEEQWFKGRLEEFWQDRMSEGYHQWHGYGMCCFDTTTGDCNQQQAPSPNLVLLMQCQCDTSDWVKSFSKGLHHHFNHVLEERGEEPAPAKEFAEWIVPIIEDGCTIITVGPFTQFDTGLSYRPSTLLRPGARVFSTSPRIGDSSFGTIGAFVKRSNDNGSDDGPNAPGPNAPCYEVAPGKKRRTDPMRTPKQAWLLSNKHVLLQRNQDLQSVEVRGAGQTLISRQVTFVGERFEENNVDAALARVEDPSDIEAF